MKARAISLLAVLLLFIAPLARGDMIALQLTSGAASVLVLDAGAGDGCPLVGCITYIGPVGNWYLNVTTGVLDPGVLPKGSIDLNSMSDQKPVTTPLVLEFTRWDMAVPLIPYGGMWIGGTTDGTQVVYDAYRDNNNNPFGKPAAGLIGTLTFALPGGTVGFSGATFGNVPVAAPAPPYSLTQRVSLSGSTSAASFDATLQPVPEPATGILFGVGLLALGTFLRRRFV